MYFRTIKQLEFELANLPIFREADRCKNGEFRISLDMQYPNGEYLDAFLCQVKGCYTISDKGGVYEYLRQIGREFPNHGDARVCDNLRSLYSVLTTSAEFSLIGTGKLGSDLMRFAQGFTHFFQYENERLKVVCEVK